MLQVPRPGWISTVLFVLGVVSGACSDVDPHRPAHQAESRPLGSEPPASARPRERQLVLLHASAGGGVLLWGLPAGRSAPETGQQPTYRLRFTSARAASVYGPPGVAVAGDPEVLDAVVSPAGDRVAAVLAGDRRLIIAETGGIPLWRRAGGAAGLAFSPDSRLLAHACAAADTGAAPWESDICLLDLRQDRPSSRRLVRLPGPQGQPSFAADGETVLFVSGHTGLASIWSVSLAGGARPVQLTNVGLGPCEGPGPRFVPVPATLRGALAMGQHLVYDSGRAVISVRQGQVRSLAPGGALVALAGRPGAALLIWQDGADLRRMEVEP